jgi:hypothetical protein
MAQIGDRVGNRLTAMREAMNIGCTTGKPESSCVPAWLFQDTAQAVEGQYVLMNLNSK